MLNPVANRLAAYKAGKHLEHEQADLCSTGQYGLDAAAYDESPEFKAAVRASNGAGIIGGGRKLKTIKGMGTVYDWRGTSWTSSMVHGSIVPRLLVQHIPVVPNLAGIADFVRLRDVLVAQGLGIQTATDRDGNVALFTDYSDMVYGQRGANQQGCGCEHMHMTIGEDWTKKQLRAAAWNVNLCKEKTGIPAHWAKLASGNGVVRVVRSGSTSHEAVSNAAGFHDRSDPGVKGIDAGGGYDREYVFRCVTVWRERIANGTADSKGMEGI
jgi:N-acetylmuramoyl-L-alanine amidase